MILETLRKANAPDPNRLSDKLKKATDEYARLVRELKLAHASFLGGARLWIVCPRPIGSLVARLVYAYDEIQDYDTREG
jgi:hypothetical protein